MVEGYGGRDIDGNPKYRYPAQPACKTSKVRRARGFPYFSAESPQTDVSPEETRCQERTLQSPLQIRMHYIKAAWTRSNHSNKYLTCGV